MTRDEIIAALESAPAKGQRKAIYNALVWAHKNEYISDGPYDRAIALLDFGAPLDAALTLVREGWHVDCLTTGDPDLSQNNPARFCRCLLRPNLKNDDGWKKGMAVSKPTATPPLAMCAAALKALD